MFLTDPLDRIVTGAVAPLAERRPALRAALRACAHIGDGLVHALFFSLLYRFGPPRLRPLIRRMLVATLAAVALHYPIRWHFRRRRPIGDLPGEYALFPKADAWSFPSGHALRNFLLADMAGRAHPALARPLRLYALSIGFARVALRLHYLSDIVAGALLGVAVGRAVDRLSGVDS